MTNNLFVKMIFRFQREEQAYFTIQGLQEIFLLNNLIIILLIFSSKLKIFKNLAILLGP